MRVKTSFTKIIFALNCVWLGTSSFKTFPSAYENSASVFVSTWVGHTASGEFKVVLKEKQGVRMANQQFYDLITRNCSADKGTMRNNSLSNNDNAFVPSGLPDSNALGTMLMVFTDVTNHKTAPMTLTIEANNAKKMRWVVTKELETITTNSKDKAIRGLSVPTTLMLEKSY